MMMMKLIHTVHDFGLQKVARTIESHANVVCLRAKLVSKKNTKYYLRCWKVFRVDWCFFLLIYSLYVIAYANACSCISLCRLSRSLSHTVCAHVIISNFCLQNFCGYFISWMIIIIHKIMVVFTLNICVCLAHEWIDSETENFDSTILSLSL